MSDRQLALAAALVELGLPLALAISCFISPRIRRHALVVLGAATPLVASYGYVVLGYLVREDQFSWAINAMWILSLAPFLACALLGTAISFARRPEHPLGRYLLGLAVPATVGLAVFAGV